MRGADPLSAKMSFSSWETLGAFKVPAATAFATSMAFSRVTSVGRIFEDESMRRIMLGSRPIVPAKLAQLGSFEGELACLTGLLARACWRRNELELPATQMQFTLRLSPVSGVSLLSECSFRVEPGLLEDGDERRVGSVHGPAPADRDAASRPPTEVAST